MEAACCRKAVLARRLPVLEELWVGEEAAILLGKPGATDNRVEISADELALEMGRLLSNPDERKRLGDNAYRISRKSFGLLLPRVLKKRIRGRLIEAE